MGKWIDKIFNIKREEKDIKTFSVRASSGSGNIWSKRDYENFAKESYLKNVIAFRSIDEIGKSVAQVPWSHYRTLSDGNREQINDSAMAELFKRPNPEEGWAFLMLKTACYLAMSGNGFFERVKPDTGPNKEDIKELYSLRPDRFTFKLDMESGRIRKYVYRNNGRKVSWEVDFITGQADILHLKNFNPVDDWWGAAATESAGREIDTSNSATEWNKNILDNEGRPGMVFTLVGAAGEDSVDQLERFLRDNHSGAKDAGRNLILTGETGTKAEPYGFSMKDLDFVEGGRELARKIATAYGVPPMILGIPGEATFANYAEARLAFWESTIFYYLNYLKTELNNWIFGKDSDEFIDFNLDDVPALAIKRDMLWKRAQDSDFIKKKKKREMVGDEKVGPEGDVILVNGSMVTLTDLVNGIEDTKKEEEKIKKELEKEGYSEDEINSMIGLM